MDKYSKVSIWFFFVKSNFYLPFKKKKKDVILSLSI